MRRALYILKVKGIKITEQEELGASIAILLHDIGHGPFSHTLEHSLIAGVHHEDISKIYIRRLNEHFRGKLNLAIEIFEGTYKKKFLHQLVSSQLDVDRLDYLTRDSFFTGVNEGAVSYERIIEMMNVHKDQLVIEQKGIYSIESFIVGRRLMYWQVYLHKTVLCVEQMVIKAIERAKFLISRGELLDASPALNYFLHNKVKLKDFADDVKVLELYSQLDDVDIFGAFKYWRHNGDKVLSMLCDAILDRKLFKIEISNKPFTKQKVAHLHEAAKKQFKLSDTEVNYLVVTDTTTNYAYNTKEERINILNNAGEIKDIAIASDQLNIRALSEPVVKHYIFYPKKLA